MEIGKKELLISIVLIIMFLIVGINTNIFAATIGPGDLKNRLEGNYENENNIILHVPDNNTTTNNTTNNNTTTNNTTTNNTTTSNNTINNNTTGNNTPGKVPDTGLEDAPWLIIGVCIVSAVFAYKKIKEYRMY